MGPEMRLVLRHAQTLRCEPLQRLQKNAPPNAVHGFHGLTIAHTILLARQVPGLLIGGLARASWLAKDRSAISTPQRKDVDVIVLSMDADLHPERFEGGVDWWMTTVSDVGHTNGNGVELIWNTWPGRDMAPGLHLAPIQLLLEWRLQEKAAFAKKRNVLLPHKALDPNHWRRIPLIHEYPTVSMHDLRWHFTHPSRWR